MGLTIRAAALTDAGTIAQLLGQLGYQAGADEVGQRLRGWLADPAGRVLVAEAGGMVTGCLALHAIPYLERTGRWCRIVSLVVDQSARRSGAGRALMQAAERTAADWGCLAVEVTSLRSRADAHAFYLSLGYLDVCADAGRFIKKLR